MKKPKPPEPDLFSWTPRARATDPETSHMAAAYSKKFKPADAVRVLRVLLAADDETGRVVDEMEELTGIQKSTVSSIFAPLRRAGLAQWKVHESGKKAGKTVRRKVPKSGADQGIWLAVRPAAEAFIAEYEKRTKDR